MKIASIQGPLELGLDYARYVQASKMDQATPPLLDLRYPHNIGDWFVTKIVDRLLDYDELILIKKDATSKEWDYINSECDAVILKGGNYIQPNWLASQFGLDVFKKIKIPIIMFGAGLQASFTEEIAFEMEEMEILKYIHDSCACSSVRGNSTAEALEKIGIKNVVVTGCPTIFWSRKPRLTVRMPQDHSAGFSFRQSLYSEDAAVYMAQFRAIETVREQFGFVKVILQGEEVFLQHYLEARQWDAEFKGRIAQVPGLNLQKLERTRLDLGHLRTEIHKCFDKFSRPVFIDWLMNNTFFSYDILEYIREYKSKGMVIGCRLHSNLLSLANETPAFYLTYDQRTQEVVDLFDIPGCRLTDFNDEIDLFNQDWGPFEKKYQFYYQEMRRFLELNNLKHTLSDSN
jgi:Polysaccharide pyruvyl transferase